MTRPIHVLLVADPDDAALTLLDELRRNDYAPTWERVETSADLRAALTRGGWDLILAEYALKHFSAAAALAVLRDSGLDIPILILTDAAEPENMRAALSLGAHDCIRVQNPARLVPAVERELRAAKVRAARALTEAALREAETRYRQLVEQLPVGVHVIDLDTIGSTLSISPPLERILGYSVAEWVADPDLWRQHIHPEDREQALADLARVYAPGAGPALAEYRMLARDGRTVWIRDETILVRDPAGQPRYLQSVKLDITERRRLEAEAARVGDNLAQWVNDLEQINREISLVDEMSQQLQTCQTAEDAYPVVADFLQLMFPAASGALYRLTPGAEGEPDQAQVAAQWGRQPPEAATFSAEACQALRRGRSVLTDGLAAGPVCAHLGLPQGGDLCVPLIAAGAAVGLIHLRLQRETAWSVTPNLPRDLLTEGKQRLAQTAAQRAAAVLATLERQAELRQLVDTAAPDAAETPVLTAGPLSLDTRTFELTVGDRTVKPTPVEFELLRFLMRNAGQVFTAEQLLQHVWGYPPGTGSQELVRAHVKNLRAKLEPDPRQPIYLKTKGRFGYLIAVNAPAADPASVADETSV